jgi:hypothetical protein
MTFSKADLIFSFAAKRTAGQLPPLAPENLILSRLKCC